MRGRARDIRDLLASGEYRPGRHEHLMPAHARAAYVTEGGGSRGRAAALRLLDAEGEALDELHRRAYAPGWAELAIRYAGAWPMPPERQAMWSELVDARAEYRSAIGAPELGSFVVGPPEDASLCHAWEADLMERIRALPDHDEAEFGIGRTLPFPGLSDE